VSAGAPFENEAYINRKTAEVYLTSLLAEVEQPLPGDVEDAEKYLSVPHKNDLNLGKRLALQFADEFLGDDAVRVADYFHGRGAYRKFKDLLDRRGVLQQWYDCESEATREALLEWADEVGLQINDGEGKIASDSAT
jgi:Uncharacterised protein family (UPF0158)